MDEQTVEKIMLNLALKLQGVPYVWGGSSPLTGLDCSGFCIWILQVAERLGTGDWTAAGLARMYQITETPKIGSLVFYGKPGKVTHVMMFAGVLNGVPMCIGASGGDSSTRDFNEAARRNAKVKMKPVDYRKDFLSFGDTTQLCA